MAYSAWLRAGALFGLILVLFASCTESDSELEAAIGVTRLYLIDPDLGPQSITEPETFLQVAEWEVRSAILDVTGSAPLQLAPQPCRFFDTSEVRPGTEGGCESGLVVDALDGVHQATLLLELGPVSVRRAAPVVLRPTGDPDGDGAFNAVFGRPCGLVEDGEVITVDCDDNCPLVSNDQADDNMDGIGNACSVFDFFAGFLRDSDGDGVADITDNCVGVSNSNQADTMGLGAEGIADGIGDACQEQVARVVDERGQETFSLVLGEFDFTQPLGQSMFVTVDFSNADALDCDWTNEKCTLNTDVRTTPVRICINPSESLALFGCLVP